MKQIIFLIFCSLFFSVNISAQKPETFDIISFKTPAGWQKKAAESAVQFTKEDKAKGTYCLMILYKSVPGTPNAKENFEMAWTSLVKEMVTVADAPKMEPAATEEGWETQSGYAAFESDGNKGVVILVTSSGFDKMVNLIILTNTDAYEKEISNFIESISLKKPETATPLTNKNSNNTALVGTWNINASEKTGYSNNNYMISGYVTRQYTFNANGTYNFYMKTYQMSVDKMFLTKENGTYQISDNTIIINPQKSVIEAWSRQGNNDIWGKKLNTQNKPLEKVTYRFTKHHFSGIDQWNLVLQAENATERDGHFSNNTTFSNAWYYSPITANNPLIDLPK